MLRASLLSSRALGHGSIVIKAGRQWLPVQSGSASPAMRTFADVKKSSIGDSKPIVLPGSASAATNEPSPPGTVATSTSSSTTYATSTSNTTIPSGNVPLVPPPPPASKVLTATPSTIGSSPSSSPPPLQARKPRRRFRRFFTTLLFLSIAGFGGGVYYSRINDNFHDFFTEYIPFGEEAVLYFEEQEFRKRFPAIINRPRTRDTGNQVKIPSQSGVSWKLAEDEKSTTPKHTNAQQTPKPSEAIQTPTEAKPEKKVKAIENVKNETSAATSKAAPQQSIVEEPAPKTVSKTDATIVIPPAKGPEPKKSSSNGFEAPEVNEPSRFPPPITTVDPINIKDAQEPLVQDLVKIINDIITVVNADNANAKFTATIGKAKSELSKFGDKIKKLKDTAAKEADDKVKASHEEFDHAAKELINRVQGEMHEQEAQWKQEYDQEREKLQQNFEQKLKAETDRAKEINEQRLSNKLLEQAVEMKQKFITEVKERVEEERSGRLGKLSDLSNTVNDLEKLTTDWNSVVDTNIKTQQLHVAVEAVRSNLEKSSMPRPFIRELAALKEIAGDDPVVNAAIASINPTAYQRGIPSSAQLIDRFRRVAGEVRKASLLPEEAGVASHASSYVLSKLMFKKRGLATGNDVESILTRTEMFLEEGNLDNAAREMNGLNGWAKTLSKDWLGEVRKVLEVQQALDVIATEARLQSLRVE